jgi:imidazolonepropionase-like amidohydrolase
MPTVSIEAITPFNTEELSAIITASHARGLKVAAHANTSGAIDTLLDLGVDTIEHGIEIYNKVDPFKNSSKQTERLLGPNTFCLLYTVVVRIVAESENMGKMQDVIC